MSQIPELGKVLTLDNIRSNLASVFTPGVIEQGFNLMDAQGLYPRVKRANELANGWVFQGEGVNYKIPPWEKVFDKDLPGNATEAWKRYNRNLDLYLLGILDTDEAMIANLPAGTFVNDRITEFTGLLNANKNRIPLGNRLPNADFSKLLVRAADAVTIIDGIQLLFRGHPLEAALKAFGLFFSDIPQMQWVVGMGLILAEEAIDIQVQAGNMEKRDEVTEVTPDVQDKIEKQFGWLFPDDNKPRTESGLLLAGPIPPTTATT